MGSRIKVIIPNSSIEFRDSQIEERKKAAAPGNEVEVICLAHGPVSIEAATMKRLQRHISLKRSGRHKKTVLMR